jgi:large subunit ribosomal protein L31
VPLRVSFAGIGPEFGPATKKPCPLKALEQYKPSQQPLALIGVFRDNVVFPGQITTLVPTHQARDMKDGIHPNYREVVFLDTSCDFGFVTRSTVATNETIKWKDGKEYPVYKIEISAESHPFYTGKQKIMDTAGRVDKFKKRYARKSAAKAAE